MIEFVSGDTLVYEGSIEEYHGLTAIVISTHPALNGSGEKRYIVDLFDDKSYQVDALHNVSAQSLVRRA